ncbi:hypothetical protein [Streptomyces sp. NPDC047981]|uniref:hypothetical protein n=1 Tax=Streptomyces sp. NPDC047981 TaxID=3154610 RepID=UPI00342BE380
MTYDWNRFRSISPALSQELTASVEYVIHQDFLNSSEELSSALTWALYNHPHWQRKLNFRWGAVDLAATFTTRVLRSQIGQQFVDTLYGLIPGIRAAGGMNPQDFQELQNSCEALVSEYLADALLHLNAEMEKKSMQNILANLDALNAQTVSLLQDGANAFITVFSDGHKLHALITFAAVCNRDNEFPFLDVKYRLRTVLQRRHGEIHVLPEDKAGSDEEIVSLVNKILPGKVLISRKATDSTPASAAEITGENASGDDGSTYDTMKFDFDNQTPPPSILFAKREWKSPEEKALPGEIFTFFDGLARGNIQRLKSLRNGDRTRIILFIWENRRYVFVGQDDISMFGFTIEGSFLAKKQGKLKLLLQDIGPTSTPTGPSWTVNLLRELTDLTVSIGATAEFTKLTDLWEFGRDTRAWDEFVDFVMTNAGDRERRHVGALSALRTARTDADYQAIYTEYFDDRPIRIDEYLHAPRTKEKFPYGAKSRDTFNMHRQPALPVPPTIDGPTYFGSVMSNEEFRELVYSRATKANLRKAVLDHVLPSLSTQTWEAFRATRAA